MLEKRREVAYHIQATKEAAGKVQVARKLHGNNVQVSKVGTFGTIARAKNSLKYQGWKHLSSG